MRCPQCSRRNNDANRFCIFCASTMTEKKPNDKRVIIPPQDILGTIKGRHLPLTRKSKRNLSPILGFIILIGTLIFVGQYLIDNMDVYEIQAIESSQNLDG